MAQLKSSQTSHTGCTPGEPLTSNKARVKAKAKIAVKQNKG